MQKLLGSLSLLILVINQEFHLNFWLRFFANIYALLLNSFIEFPTNSRDLKLLNFFYSFNVE